MFKSLVLLGAVFAASGTLATDEQPEQVLEGNTAKGKYAPPPYGGKGGYVGPISPPLLAPGPIISAPVLSQPILSQPILSQPLRIDEPDLIGPSRLNRPYGKFGRDGLVAKALNISEPVYICPKPGYVLYGEDCIFTETIPARLECPIGYTPVGGRPGKPELCQRRIAPALTCSHGHLINGLCRIAEFSEPIFSCPHGADLGHDGTCTQLELVEPLARCPEGSTRINHNCVVIEYLNPAYVCPPNSIQDGRRCRVETLVLSKKKGRKLEGDMVETEKEDTMSGESYVLDGDVEYMDEDGLEEDIDLLSELPPHVYEADDFDGETTWLPATSGVQMEEDNTDFLGTKAKYSYKYSRKDKDGYGWGKDGWGKGWNNGLTPYGSYGAVTTGWNTGLGLGPVGSIGVTPIATTGSVLLPAQQPLAMELPLVTKGKKKNKEIKVKVAKVPEQLVRIDSIPAQKICEVGERVGATCVLQTIVESILECPVPLIHGKCARRVQVPGITRCPVGNLVCPPHLPGRACQCETVLETTPAPICHTGIFDLGECVSTAHPKEYCPIGAFLDADGLVCIRRDIEPALCLFSVTYSCPDCHNHFPFPPHHHHPHFPIPPRPVPHPIPGPHPLPYPLPGKGVPPFFPPGKGYPIGFPTGSSGSVLIDQPTEIVTGREIISKGKRGDLRWGK